MIEINCDILNFTFSDHISIIGGTDDVGFQSGTHKTHLFKLLEDQQRLGRMHSNKKVHFIETLESFNTLNVLLTSDDCLIADELNFSASGLDLLFQKVRDANAYLIAIGRIYIKQFEYSVDAIYQIERDGNRFALKRAFQNVNSQLSEINHVICEDSSAVAAIYSETLECDVKSAGSRSNFFRILEKGVTLLIADKPKFGSELLNLLYLIKTKKSSVEQLVLFLPTCFEEIICEVGNVNQNSYNIDDYFDFEMYYEKLASQIPEWNKRKVASSIFTLHENYDFATSGIIRDLHNFYKNLEVQDASRCYTINTGCFELERELEDAVILLTSR